jgi:hypothetical protein
MAALDVVWSAFMLVAAVFLGGLWILICVGGAALGIYSAWRDLQKAKRIEAGLSSN